ncbi:hypothetical protein GSI_13393 [Ganoderma sinense ZZ0214-1]|uniref:F-box domain-containing protein n=1 Tax=Ganoderma sinense ZZ0214-1 TaxID=1077348 RepID=A0A2G8RVG5_9APHY|nr:hypothetical protein GSI_13393 [Ganoderma sinense ZZ0214-1]
MIFLQAKNDPNVVAQRFLDGLQHGQYKLGHETLKDLNSTVTLLLAFVRHQMNAHAPIHALPTELLQLVFAHTLAPPAAFLPFDPRGARADPRAEARRTLALTHVCRRWRHIALDTGALWTRIAHAHTPGNGSPAGSEGSTNSDSACAAAFFARSKAASLDVHAPFPASQFLRTALAPHAGRIRSLALTLPAEERSTIPTPSASGDNSALALPFALPNLESLALTTECDPFDDRRPLLDLHAPCALFSPSSGTPNEDDDEEREDDGGTPRLRRLLLRNMCWVPRAPLGQLTHLFLTEGTSVPLPALLSFLARCAALEVLVLADVYVDVAGSITPLPPSPENRVALPKLRRCTLGIGGALLNMRRVLTHVAFPPDVTLRVSGSKAFHALSHLAPFPDLAFAQVLDTLSVDFAPHGKPGAGIVIRASGPSPSPTGDKVNGDAERRGPGLLLEFPTYRGTPAECVLMRGLMRALVPLARLVDVRYRVCPHQKEPLHVLGGDDVSLDALKTFRLVEGTCAHQDRDHGGEVLGEAVRKVLGRCPGLEEVEVWAEDSAALREHIGNVAVCRGSSSPPMEIAGTDIDWAESPFEWTRAGWGGGAGVLGPTLEEVQVWVGKGDKGMPARLVPGGSPAPALARMVVHCSSLGGGMREGDMEIPGTDIDWVDSPFE